MMRPGAGMGTIAIEMGTLSRTGTLVRSSALSGRTPNIVNAVATHERPMKRNIDSDSENSHVSSTLQCATRQNHESTDVEYDFNRRGTFLPPTTHGGMRIPGLFQQTRQHVTSHSICGNAHMMVYALVHQMMIYASE